MSIAVPFIPAPPRVSGNTSGQVNENQAVVTHPNTPQPQKRKKTAVLPPWVNPQNTKMNKKS
jgi:hypothetical protein